jgi:hypothetical protein
MARERSPQEVVDGTAKVALARRDPAEEGHELQRLIGNRALARRLAQAPKQRVPSGGPLLQRLIGFVQLGLPGLPYGFYRGLNAAGRILRPQWVGHWAGVHPPAGQARNHIIPYQLIGEALTNVSQAIYNAAAAGLPTAGLVQQLVDITESLYPNPAAAAGHAAMVASREALANAILNVVNHAAPTLIEQATMALRATTLEAELASAQQNVRLGNRTMNLRLGANVDPILVPNMCAVPAAPGPIVNLPAGLVTPAPWTLPAKFGHTRPVPPAAMIPLGPGSQFYAMTPTSNNIVYRFLTHATAHLGHEVTVVRNAGGEPIPLPGGLYPANAPLSSSPLPAGALGPEPLLVFDPAGAALPYTYG